VAGWHWEAWGRSDPDGSLAGWTDGLRRRSGRDRIPISWVALLADTPVGSVALVESDMASHPELTPWLSGLMVLPAYRGRGIGTALTAQCEATAARLGVGRLYLYTESAAAFYAARGWRAIGHETDAGELVSIMAADLARAEGSTARQPR
jgi:N-acetylglutamate synthase-like GNAT family acetyltransferase